MPKRSNHFQRLVYLIQEQLKDRADAVVTESRMLRDRQTGHEREVDIVVECKPNGFTYLLAFECCRTGRKATIEWVERMLQKHRCLSDKLVLVTRSGFTRTAVDVAERHRAETVTLREAGARDWPAVIDGYTMLYFCLFDFRITSCSTECDPAPVAGPLAEFPENHEMLIVNARGEAHPLNDVVNAMAADHSLFGRPAMERWYNLPLDERREQHQINFDFTPLQSDPLALLNSRMLYRIRRIYGTANMLVTSADLSMGPNQYKDMRVMHGTTQLSAGSMSGKTLHVMLGERQGEQPKGTILFASDDSKAQPIVRTVELEPKQPDGQSGESSDDIEARS